MPSTSAWTIEFEDAMGKQDPSVFLTRESRDKAVQSTLGYIMGLVEAEWKAAGEDLDEYHQELKTLSEAVRAHLAAGRVDEALELWEEFAQEDEYHAIHAYGTIRVRETTAA